MSGKLLRHAYEKLIEEDIAALRGVTHDRLGSLEFRHIIDVLKDSVTMHYDVLPERDRLKAAIVAHRSQKADDRCIEDDDRLYESLGDGIKCDRRVGDPEAMLKNCARFIERRCVAGGWPTYAELEKDISKLRMMLWLRHDAQHSGVLYGDDGEMQCAACGIDFKRFGVAGIEKRFSEIGLQRLALAQAEPAPSRAVIVHVVSGDGCWLMQRKPPLIFHGMWATPGGHIEPGETALQAAKREVKEEMAITVATERFVPFGPPSHHVRPNGTKSVLEYFLLRLVPHEVPLCTEPDKHTPWEHFLHHQPPKPVTPGTEIALGRWLTWEGPK